MSNEVYPTLPGLDFDVHRTPVWTTAIRTTPSGREFRNGQQLYPRYKRQLQYEFLRSSAAYQELQALEGFFNRHRGSLDSWLLNDPDDNYIANQLLGVGDGVTTAFQALRTRGGFSEPLYQINTVQSLTVADWQADLPSLQPYPRTNYLLYSVAYNQPAWSKQNSSTSPNSITAPDGSLTGDKVIPNTNNVGHSVGQAVTLPGNVYYVHSAYIKAGEYGQAYMSSWGAGAPSFISVNIDLTTGQYSALSAGATASVTPVGGGWYRCTLGGVTTSGGGVVNHVVGLSQGSNWTFAGDGTSGIYAWGSQTEVCGQAGLAPTGPSRYITTAATAVTVPADYTLASGLFTLAAAPASGANVNWTGNYYWRCRFDTDELDFTKFMNQLWKTGSVPLITIKT